MTVKPARRIAGAGTTRMATVSVSRPAVALIVQRPRWSGQNAWPSASATSGLPETLQRTLSPPAACSSSRCVEL